MGEKATGSLSGQTGSVEKPPTNEYGLLKDFIAAFAGPFPPATLVFGDSVFLRVADDDQSSQPLSEALRADCQDDVFIVAGSGYHAGIFERFAALLPLMPSRPRFAVIPVNLRSFSSTWDLNPLYQYRHELELMASFDVNEPYYSLPTHDPAHELSPQLITLAHHSGEIKTLKDFLDLIGCRDEIGSSEWFKRIKLIFQYHYTCPLNPTHRKVQSIRQTIRILQKLGVDVYCYVTPINYEAGLEYCGSEFYEAVRNNALIARREIESIASCSSSRIDSCSFRFDDFSFSLPREVFFTGHNASEHLRFAGRDFLAQQIIEKGRFMRPPIISV